MVTSKSGVTVEVGDWVGDPLDNWEKNKVERILKHDDGDATLFMRGGNVMGLNEVDRDHIWLPSEIAGYD